MTDNVIQLKKNNILKLEIATEDGTKTGDFLEFDLEDIDLPFVYQDMIEKMKKSRNNLKNQLAIIDKKEDHKGKKLMSSNEEAKYNALRSFYKEQEEIYNMFLGKDGVKKLLHGRKLGWTTLAEIDEIIEEQIAPKLNLTMKSIQDNIKKKFAKKEENVIE